MTDDHEPEPEAESPWAPGGEMSRVPVPPANPVFEPAAGSADDDPDDQWRRGGTAPAASGATDRPAGPPDPARKRADGADEQASTHTPAHGPRPEPRSLRDRRIPIAVGVVAAVVAGGVWMIGRDTGGEPAAEPQVTVPLSDPPASTAPPSTLPTVVEPVDGAASAETRTDSEAPDVEVGVPAALSDLAPTELVALTEAGAIIEFDTSTGVIGTRIDDVDLGGPTLAVSDNATVVWSPGSAELVVVRRGLPVVDLDAAAPVGEVVAEFDDEFLLRPTSPSGQAYELRLDNVLRTAVLDFPVGGPWSAQPHPSGGIMVPTVDGTSLLGFGDPEPIGPGTAVAAGRGHVLFRECDALSTCTVVRQEVATGSTVELGPEIAQEIALAGLLWLSPDGGALVVARNGLQDGLDGAALRIVELDTAAVLDVPADPNQLPPIVSWAPDSSGFFTLSGRAPSFVSRADGAVGDLGELSAAIGAVADLRARPASTTEPSAPGRRSSLVVTLSGLTGLELAAYTSEGEVIEIDIDGRTYTSHEGRPLGSGSPAYVFPDRDGVTVASWDNVPGFRINYGSEPFEMDGSDLGFKLIPGPDPLTVWRSSDRFRSGAVGLELVDSIGRDLEQRIEIDGAFALGSDGTGSVLVTAPGGIYVAAPSGATRLTDGSLLAVGSGAAYAKECDQFLACGVVRIDRATGQRQTVDHPAFASAATDPWQVGSLGQTVSPDGDVAFLQASPNSFIWNIVDLVSGQVVEIDGPAVETPFVWSDDSNYAVYLSVGELHVYDRAAARLVELGQLPAIKAFAEVADVDINIDISVDVDGFQGIR